MINKTNAPLSNRLYWPKIKEYLLTVFILSVIFAVIYYRMFFLMHGFLQFGNFSQNLNLAEMNQFFPFYNPFQNFGLEKSFPLASIEYYLLNMTLLVPFALIWGSLFGTKIFIFLASLIYGVSFYFFTGIFSKKILYRMLGTIFLLFNPFTFQIYASGDFSQLIFQSFIFISTGILSLTVLRDRHKTPLYAVSGLILVLSFALLQAFLAAILFYTIFGVYTIFFKMENVKIYQKTRILLRVVPSVVFWLTVFTILMILPAIFGSQSYLPGSITSLPLSSFKGGALGVFNVISLKAYPPFTSWISVHNTFGTSFFYFWSVVEISIIFLILLSFIPLRDKRLAYVSLLILVVSMFASETAGPLGPLTVFLYENFPTYQALNYPYLWTWFIITPLYASGFIILLERLSWRVERNVNLLVGRGLVHKINISHGRLKSLSRKKNLQPAKIIVIVLLVIMVISPILSQGTYGTHGIREKDIPNWFNTLDSELYQLTIKNNSGIIFNTLNSFFFFGNNSTKGVSNLLQTAPQFRTIALSAYLPDHNTVTDFYYWFYYTLYTNGSKDLAGILASKGIQFFVNLYNTNSEEYQSLAPWSYGINVSSILDHQSGWKKVIITGNYTIYRDTQYKGDGYYTNNTTLVLGNYDTLNYMSALGVNLSNTTTVFPTDLSSSQNYFQLLNQANLVVLGGQSAFMDLALSRSFTDIIYPSNFVNSQFNNYSMNWINSERINNYPEYGTLIPFAITYGENMLNIPFSLQTSGNYNIFLKVMFSNNTVDNLIGGSLNINLKDGTSLTIDTVNSNDNATNSFQWVEISSHLQKGENYINLTSLKGLNAVKQIYVLTENQLNSDINFTENFLSFEKNKVLQIFPGYTVVPSANSTYHYTSLKNSAFPDGNILYGNVTYKPMYTGLSSVLPFTGTLDVGVLSNGYSTLNLTYDKTYTNISISPGQYHPLTNAPSGSIFFKVTNFTNGNICFSRGTPYIGYLALLPNNYLHQPTMINSTLNDVSSITHPTTITNLSYKIIKDKNTSSLYGSFDYCNTTKGSTLKIMFNLKYNYSLSPSLSLNIFGDAVGNINKISIGNKSGNSKGVFFTPNLNDGSANKARNVTLEIQPTELNSMKTVHITFKFTFYGFYVVPQSLLSYSPTIHPTLGFEFNLDGFRVPALSQGLFVSRSPFIDGVSSVDLNPSSNGLTTILLNDSGESTVILYHSFSMFLEGSEIAFILITAYITVSYFRWRKNFQKK